MDVPHDNELKRIEALIDEMDGAIGRDDWDDVIRLMDNIVPLIQYPLSPDVPKDRLATAMDRVQGIEQRIREHMQEISQALATMSNQRRIVGRYGSPE